MSVSLLLADQNESWMKEMQLFLSSKKFVVDHALFGREAQLKAYKKKYFSVVLDIGLQNHSGLEVLKYLRLNHPSVKVILTLPNKECLEELELTKEDLKKLGAETCLIKPFTEESLLQAIEGTNHLDSWRSVQTSGGISEEVQVNAADNLFTHIRVEEFFSENVAVYDLYLRLGTNKYLKILKAGDYFETARMKKYKEQENLEFLYFKTEDRGTYINFVNQLLDKVIKSTKVSPERKIRLMGSLVDKYIEEIYTMGIKPQLVDEGKKICQNIFSAVERNQNLNNLLVTYEEKAPNAYNHLFLTAFISAVIAKNLDWCSARTTDIVTYGALFHDIGKLKVSPKILDTPYEELRGEDLLEYQKHPEYGVEMLRGSAANITEPILQIVYQHHELVTGEGYPNRLTGIRIYPLAKIVSLANFFSHYISDKKLSALDGIRSFVPNKNLSLRYDPLVVKGLILSFISKDEK